MTCRRVASQRRSIGRRRLVAERLVEGLGDAFEQHRLRVDLELLVPGPVPLGDSTRMLALVVAAVGEPDRKGAHRLG